MPDEALQRIKMNNKKEMIQKIVPAVSAVLGIVLALSPFILFPVCTMMMKNGKHMSCYYSAWFWIGVAAVIIVSSVIAFFVRKKAVQYAVYLIHVLGAIVGYLVPKRMIAIGHMKTDGWQFGLCGSPDMPCQTNTLPAVSILLLCIGILGVVGLLWTFLSESKQK